MASTTDQASATLTEQTVLSTTGANTVQVDNPGTNEDDLDKQFFHNPTKALKDMKLNKGEKRALKFMLKKETGETIDINEFLKSQNITELKTLLTKEAKAQEAKHSNFQETGMAKRQYQQRASKNNHSNKMAFKDMMDSD